MHRILCGIAALSMMVAVAFGATTPAAKKKGTVARTPVVRKKPVTTLQKSVVKKRAVTSAPGRKKAPPAKPAVTWRNRQLQPSQDRYKEIQEALASKGYLPAEQATGTWDQNSTGALKQFQEAQNLDASGKINALSLIALGLGPKHEAAPAMVSQPADQSR